MAYTGWLIGEEERGNLMAYYPPRYPDVIAHHITKEFPTPKDAAPPEETEAVVIGVADDGKGIQALVCQINGSEERPDGGVYHITWSMDIDAGYSAKMSNDVIENEGWIMRDPITIQVTPKLFRY